MEAIKISNLSKQVGMFSLLDVSLTIPAGKITTIVGPNGSGKSTLLKTIARLIPFNNGDIYINKKNIKLYKTKKFAQTIAMLPQSKDDLPNLTVFEIITFGRAPYQSLFSNRLTANDLQLIEEAMQITGVTPFRDRLFHHLSGGEQQRVRLAMALAQDTRILLLDEPTTFLDMTYQFELMDLLTKINKTLNTTIIMVLHDLQQAASYGHKMIALKKGEVITSGDPRDILTADFLKEIYNLEASIFYKNNFPLIIPNTNKQQEAIK